MDAKKEVKEAQTTEKAKPTFMHPLMGASIPLLLDVLASGVQIRAVPQACVFSLSALGRLPFGLLERYVIHPKRKVERYLETPLFIIGHWRSGTTHLHNLMSHSCDYGMISPLASGLPCELLTLATWLKPLLEKSLPADRGVDRVAVTPDSPQEDEIPVANLQNLSIYHALYRAQDFEKQLNRGVFFEGVGEKEVERWREATRYFLSKVGREQKNPRLLIKNPVYTARIARLREIWPDAKFIHIYRNPYAVFPSTVHYFKKMLRMLSLQDISHINVEKVVIELYLKLMERYDAESTMIPEGNLCEVSFETLEESPLEELERIHEELQLPGWEITQARIEAYLSELKDYRKNEFKPEEKVISKVEHSWGKYIERWDYSP